MPGLFLLIGTAQAQPPSYRIEAETFGSIPTYEPPYPGEEGISRCRGCPPAIVAVANASRCSCPNLPRCSVGVVETQKPEVRCYTTEYSVELEVQQYAKHRKVQSNNGWLVAVQLKGSAHKRMWMNIYGQTCWRVLPNKLYSIYAWTPSGYKCPSRTVFTKREGSFIHVGMGCPRISNQALIWKHPFPPPEVK